MALYPNGIASQGGIAGDEKLCGKGAKFVGSGNGVFDQLAFVVGEFYLVLLVSILYPCLPVLLLIYDGRELYALTGAIYGSVGVHGHTGGKLAGRSIIIVASVVSDFGQTTISTQAYMKGVLLVIASDNSVRHRSTTHGIYHTDTWRTIGHVHAEGLKAGNHKCQLGFLGLLAQFSLRLAIHPEHISAWCGGSQQRIFLHQFALPVIHAPCQLAHVAGVHVHA